MSQRHFALHRHLVDIADKLAVIIEQIDTCAMKQYKVDVIMHQTNPSFWSTAKTKKK